jgi:hypothetical protein
MYNEQTFKMLRSIYYNWITALLLSISEVIMKHTGVIKKERTNVFVCPSFQELSLWNTVVKAVEAETTVSFISKFRADGNFTPYMFEHVVFKNIKWQSSDCCLHIQVDASAWNKLSHPEHRNWGNLQKVGINLLFFTMQEPGRLSSEQYPRCQPDNSY